MANTYTQILMAGTQAAYNLLESKDSNKLYFCTDTGKIYKGEVDFTNHIIAAATKPETPVAGKIYILADTGTVEAYVSGAWKVLSYPVATTVDMDSDDVHVATAAAVYDAIQAAIGEVTGGSTVVKSVAAGEAAAQVKVTKGDGSTESVTVPGVVTKPTWDAAQRKLTIPVTGDTAVEVNIGKDIFLDPAGDSKYNEDTKEIELYLNDGNKIVIPAADLVDVYTGQASNSATVNVSGTTISVNVKLDPEGNAIVAGENGLKVDLSAYCTTQAMNTAVSGVQTALDAAEEDIAENTAALAILNGNESTDGSVDYKVKAARDALNSQISGLTGRVSTLETDNTQNKADIQTNEENIAALAAATTAWGSF